MEAGGAAKGVGGGFRERQKECGLREGQMREGKRWLKVEEEK